MSKKSTPADRQEVALYASYEIEELIELLRSGKLEDYTTFEWLEPFLLQRVHSLNSVIMSILGGDDTRTTEEMKLILERPPALRVDHGITH